MLVDEKKSRKHVFQSFVRGIDTTCAKARPKFILLFLDRPWDLTQVYTYVVLSTAADPLFLFSFLFRQTFWFYYFFGRFGSQGMPNVCPRKIIFFFTFYVSGPSAGAHREHE